MAPQPWPLAPSVAGRYARLVPACVPCNQAKGSAPVEVFLADRPEVLKALKAQLRRPLADTAAVNATRYAVGKVLKALGLPTRSWPSACRASRPATWRGSPSPPGARH